MDLIRKLNLFKLKTLLAFTFFLLLAGVALIGSNPFLNEPGHDGGLFMYAGRQILQGRLLYIDVWDSKGPIIYYLNAIGLWLGRQMRWGIWGIEMLFLLGSSILCFYIAKHKWRTTTALLSATFFLLGFKNLIGNGNFTEEYSLLFTWVSILTFSLLLKNPEKGLELTMLGAALVLNFLTRANNIGTSATLILIWSAVSLKRFGFLRTVSNSKYIFLGVFCIGIPILGFHAYLGNLDEMYHASITYNILYSFSTRTDVENFNILTASLIPGFRTIPNYVVLAGLGFLYCLRDVYIRFKAKQTTGWDAMILLCWPVELVMSSVSGRSYAHYIMSWLPIITLLAGHFFELMERHLVSPDKQYLFNKKPQLAFGLGIILIFYFSSPEISGYLKTVNQILFNRSQGIEKNNPVAILVSEITNPEEKVLVWGGQAGINLMSDRDSSTAYLNYPAYSNTGLGAILQQKYFDDLVNNKPRIIIDAHIHSPDVIPSLDPYTRRQQNLLFPLANNIELVLNYIEANYEVLFILYPYKVYTIKTNLPTTTH